MYKHRTITIIGLLLLVFILPIVTPQKAESAKFILANWDYPDEYGQGISRIRFYENSTGSWLSASGWIDYDETLVPEWEAGVAIKIECLSVINATLTGAPSSYEGRNYIRHNVTVTNLAEQVVFSKQNFTFILEENYEYEHEVILNFIPQELTLYTIELNCEIYGEGSESFYDDSKTSAFNPDNSPYVYYDIFSDRTFFSFHAADYDPWVIYYDHSSSEWSDAYEAGETQLPDTDYHGCPVLWVNSSGFCHVLFGAHGDAGDSIQHRVTTSAYDISSWTDGTTLASGERPTYPSVSYDGENEVVHVTYRARNGALGENDMKYVNSTDDGDTWSTPQIIIDMDQSPDDESTYGQGHIDPFNTDIIHLDFKVFNDSASAEERFFYAYLNVTNGHLYNASGYDLGTSISGSELWSVTFYGTLGTGERCLTADAHPDALGNMYITFSNKTANNNKTIYFTYYNVTTNVWSSPEYLTTSYDNRPTHDFLVNDVGNITAFLPVGRNITRWSWDGSTWTLEEHIRNSTTYQLGIGFCATSWNNSYNPEITYGYSEWNTGGANMRAWAWGSSGNVDYIQGLSMGWNEISDVTLYVSLPYNTWGLQGLIIILGMIMVPASTMYLIVGAKHDRSMDRLYYGLVAFFIGWALLIGGIIG